MTDDEREIRIVWDQKLNDWCAIVPTPYGTCMAHGRTPVLALQAGLRMAGLMAHQKIARRE